MEENIHRIKIPDNMKHTKGRTCPSTHTWIAIDQSIVCAGSGGTRLRPSNSNWHRPEKRDENHRRHVKHGKNSVISD